MVLQLLTLILLTLSPTLAENPCFDIGLEPNLKEIKWKMNVTLICRCKCKQCYNDRAEEYREIEVYRHLPDGTSQFLAAAVNDRGNGSYVIVPNENSAVQNGMRYSCMVSRVGMTDTKVNFTVIEPPPVITNFTVAPGNDSVTATAVYLRWVVPKYYPPTKQLTIAVSDTVKGGYITVPINSPSESHKAIENLVPFRKYKFTITNYNLVGFREASEPISITTEEAPPKGRPLNLRIASLSHEDLLISWEPPAEDSRNGIIVEYETICYYQCEEGCGASYRSNSATTTLAPDTQVVVDEQIEYSHSVRTPNLTWSLSGLKEESKYSCYTRAFTRAGMGPATNPVVGRTFKAPIITTVPPIVPLPATVSQETRGTNNQLPALVIGIVAGVLVVSLIGLFLFINRERLFSGTHSILKSEEDAGDSTPTLGNYDKNLQVIIKDPMEEVEKGSTIPKLETVPKPGYTPIPTPGLNTLISSKPNIPNESYPTHVEQLHANGNVGFNREYSSVNPASGWSHEVGSANKSKNRYYNVKCYDHTRVKLQTMSGGESDFINGNFVDGFKQSKAYIATQGPLPNTCLDFWRMVWEQKSTCIVMVTNLVELARVKCHQYYPESGSMTFGPATITMLECIQLADFTIRTFKLEMVGEEPILVKHFHFTSWPDHGVPPFSNAILSFVRHVKNVKTVDSGPLIVHCSAGVGRTGTFMAIDSMLDMSEKENCVDIFGFVTRMRTCRPSMVQTLDQYIFIHDAILEALTCGVTEVRARDLPNHFKWLLDTDSFTNNIRLVDEFDRLGYNIRDLTHQMTTAQMDQNASKNRNRMFIPYDQGRVWLFPLPKQPYSNYINASYIDGFRTRKAFIATQSPLPQTVSDFWRMVWELHSLTIVMLNREDESEPYEAYFPLSGSAEFGNIRVEFLRQDEHRDYSVSILKIYNKEEGLNRTISHFQYFAWSEESPPNNCSTLLEMITRLNKCQQSCGNRYPVVAHCDYGMGRAGAFLALCICLERMKVENVVDVFQTVRTMRSQRPVMVNTTMLYRFIFTSLVEYLQTLDLYANIK